MEHHTAGDPINGLKWTRKTTLKISRELHKIGIMVSPKTVGRLLRGLKFSLRVNHKKVTKAARTDDGTHTGGHRLYTEADVARLRFIHHARLVALGLADISELLALAGRKSYPGSQPEYQEVLNRHLREIDERMRHLMSLRTVIEDLIPAARLPKNQWRSWGTCGCMPKTESTLPLRKHVRVAR